MTWLEEREADLLAFAASIVWPQPRRSESDQRLNAVAAAVANLLTDRPDADVRTAIAELLAYTEDPR